MENFTELVSVLQLIFTKRIRHHETNKELTALFHLIDDPDQEVFEMVSQKIVDYGKPVIPNLENLWETTPDLEIQLRIEQLIHKLHYRDLTEEFRQWSISGHHDLMLGALLVCKFQYPDLNTTSSMQEIEKVRRNIWLELNNYLTPPGTNQYSHQYFIQLLWLERNRNQLPGAD